MEMQLSLSLEYTMEQQQSTGQMNKATLGIGSMGYALQQGSLTQHTLSYITLVNHFHRIESGLTGDSDSTGYI